jgi:hypothetical protein
MSTLEDAEANTMEIPVACGPSAVMFRVMDWQQFLALLIVALAAGLLLWGRLRPRRFRFGRDTHCGCSSPSSSGPRTSIVFHARKGEQPRVLVKMK